MSELIDQLAAELAALAGRGRLRTCIPTDGSARTRPFPGRTIVSFSSNDYLGLAGHPTLAAAAMEAIRRDGTTASASRLLGGSLAAVRFLEARLAEFLELPAALVFPTGYQANLGVLTALAGRDDLVVSDALNHASLIDACRLSRTQIAVYPHLNVAAAAAALKTAGPFRRRLLVTESLFSMEGDAAPIASLAEVAHQHRAAFVVDEAHAIGVLGPIGRGLCAAAGVKPDVLIGTLGKALAAGGGFVAGETVLRDLLVNRARTFIYTTALAPPVAAAASAAIDLAAGPDGDRRRASLRRALRRLTDGLENRVPLPPNLTGPIVPIWIGDDREAVRVSAELDKRGVFAPAIRPPTVPEGTARLRVSLSAGHTDDDIDRLAAALRVVLPLSGAPPPLG